MVEPEETIPGQHEGVEVNVEDSVDLPDEEGAKRFF